MDKFSDVLTNIIGVLMALLLSIILIGVTLIGVGLVWNGVLAVWGQIL